MKEIKKAAAFIYIIVQARIEHILFAYMLVERGILSFEIFLGVNQDRCEWLSKSLFMEALAGSNKWTKHHFRLHLDRKFCAISTELFIYSWYRFYPAVTIII